MAVLSPIERAEQELASIQSAMTSELEAPQPSTEQVNQHQPPQHPESSQELVSQRDDYYKKWRSLDGMLRKKDEQIAQLMQQNNEILQRLNDVTLQITQQPHVKPPTVDDVMSQLSEEYGGDSVAMIRKVVMAEAGAEISELKAEIARLKGVADSVSTLAADQGRTKSELFQAELTNKVGDWRALIASPAWRQWLETNSDELTGASFAALFDQANEDWNMHTMVALFNKFKAASQQPEQVDPRAHLVTPGGTGVGAPASAQPKMWTESEVMAAYDKQRRGFYTAEQWAAIDADITQANAEGRIVIGR